MKTLTLKGCGTALFTPFKGDKVDYEAFAATVDRQIEAGIHFLVPLGTTGETPCLSTEERIEILKIAKAHSAGRPVIVGGGTNSLTDTIASIRTLEPYGPDAFLIVVPYYNKPNQRGLAQHFKQIADASPVPVIIYNVPGRTGVNISAETTLQLANECPNIVGIKEASGNIAQVMQILRNKPDRFMVISGDDSLTYPMIALGASGVISVIANALPKEMSAMVKYALKGDQKKALPLHYKMLPLMNAIFDEGNPSGIKALLEIEGHISNTLRMPLVKVSKPLYNKISALYDEFNA